MKILLPLGSKNRLELFKIIYRNSPLKINHGSICQPSVAIYLIDIIFSPLSDSARSGIAFKAFSLPLPFVVIFVLITFLDLPSPGWNLYSLKLYTNRAGVSLIIFVS